jgi:hypothetical protein
MAASPTRGWAESYKLVGWRPFPLVPGSKRPAFAGWQQTAGDESRFEGWFRRDEAAIGLIAGESFDVWDIEHDHLPAFRDYMTSADRSLAVTPVADTGRGGLHIYTMPVGARRTAKLLLDGVHIGEVKRSGFVVAPPTMGAARQYRWRFAPCDLVVAAAPDWLVGLVAPEPPFVDKPVRQATTLEEALRRLNALARAVARTDEGNRNNMLYWAARRATEEGIPAHATARAMSRAAADAGCPRREVEATLRSALGAP